MDHPPVLFLDVDGVLNCAATFKNKVPGEWPIESRCLKELDRIIRDTRCFVVVSSTWRMRGVDVLRRFFLKKGLTRAGALIGRTPVLPKQRGYEIGAWLLEHPDVKVFAIVDDDDDMGNHIGRLVQTDFAAGLTREHADRLIALLQERP